MEEMRKSREGLMERLRKREDERATEAETAKAFLEEVKLKHHLPAELTVGVVGAGDGGGVDNCGADAAAASAPGPAGTMRVGGEAKDAAGGSPARDGLRSRLAAREAARLAEAAHVAQLAAHFSELRETGGAVAFPSSFDRVVEVMSDVCSTGGGIGSAPSPGDKGGDGTGPTIWGWGEGLVNRALQRDGLMENPCDGKGGGIGAAGGEEKEQQPEEEDDEEDEEEGLSLEARLERGRETVARLDEELGAAEEHATQVAAATAAIPQRFSRYGAAAREAEAEAAEARRAAGGAGADQEQEQQQQRQQQQQQQQQQEEEGEGKSGEAVASRGARGARGALSHVDGAPGEAPDERAEEADGGGGGGGAGSSFFITGGEPALGHDSGDGGSDGEQRVGGAGTAAAAAAAVPSPSARAARAGGARGARAAAGATRRPQQQQQQQQAADAKSARGEQQAVAQRRTDRRTRRQGQGAAQGQQQQQQQQQPRSTPDSPPKQPTASDDDDAAAAAAGADEGALEEGEPPPSAYEGAREAASAIDAKLEELMRCGGGQGGGEVAGPEAIADLLRQLGAKAPKAVGSGCGDRAEARGGKPEPRTFPLRPKHVQPVQQEEQRQLGE